MTGRRLLGLGEGIDNPAGPKAYNVSKDADVTVVFYNKRNVKVNYAFKKGQLTAKDVDKIVSEISKITPEKKSK